MMMDLERMAGRKKDTEMDWLVRTVGNQKCCIIGTNIFKIVHVTQCLLAVAIIDVTQLVTRLTGTGCLAVY